MEPGTKSNRWQVSVRVVTIELGTDIGNEKACDEPIKE